ncbi:MULTISPECIES: ABC-type transport auxiliary lipoprotein family protein [Sphingomonadaceae]|nr:MULTISPECIES: ABC-type transport auxiliary lipoprotein family protein [Sphingomonadaceae]QNG48797.1 membrane integrity-associated transporter subunit PqiC [Sphingobium yanoikuyae]
MKQNQLRRGYCALALLMPLAACGAMLGSGKPDNLFRFGVPEREDAQAGTANAAPVTLSLARIRFAPEIEGDRILTARGDSVLYIKDARWAAPAPDLFSQALARQFATQAPHVRLRTLREGSADALVLRLDVDRFEARYGRDVQTDTPPVILVSAIAELLDPMTRQIIERRRFSAEEAATLNAKAAIVAAFDKAVGRVSIEIVGWSVGTAQTRPPVAAGRSQ